MGLKSFQHNGILWKCSILAEKAMLLEPDSESVKLSKIHQFSEKIEEQKIKGIVEIVPAYESLAIIFDYRIKNHIQLIEALKEMSYSKFISKEPAFYEVPVCYEHGLDWDDLTDYTGKSRTSIIERHKSQIYTVAMMGFIPGFVFLDGMETSISCPRKTTPRTKIPKGSVGIGGNQTGIYSIESPGGWNIIGRTPISFFNVYKKPPTMLKAGDQITFTQISKSKFEEF